jgi:site-specific DNA recombinase
VPGQSLGAQALVDTHLERAVLQYDAVELVLTNSHGAAIESVSLDWQRKPLTAEKGTTAELPPATHNVTKARGELLTAIAKARRWIEEISDGDSFAAIAQREGKSARQMRLLAPLAFVSPVTVRSLVEGTARAGTVTDLAKRVPLIWNSSVG